jgi:hypothetical protein
VIQIYLIQDYLYEGQLLVKLRQTNNYILRWESESAVFNKEQEKLLGSRTSISGRSTCDVRTVVAPTATTNASGGGSAPTVAKSPSILSTFEPLSTSASIKHTSVSPNRPPHQHSYDDDDNSAGVASATASSSSASATASPAVNKALRRTVSDLGGIAPPDSAK